jgi:hypothetical protein
LPVVALYLSLIITQACPLVKFVLNIPFEETETTEPSVEDHSTGIELKTEGVNTGASCLLLLTDTVKVSGVKEIPCRTTCAPPFVQADVIKKPKIINRNIVFLTVIT